MISKIIQAVVPPKLLSKIHTLYKFPAYFANALFPDTLASMKRIRQLAIFFNQKDFKERKALAENAFNNIPEKNTIPYNQGFLIEDFTSFETMQTAIKDAKKIAETINFEEKAKTARKNFLIQHHLDFEDPKNANILKLATSPEIIQPIAEYFGSIPVLKTMDIWFSPNQGVPEDVTRSQLYHLDGEDIQQIKCFIPLEEVNQDAGPLTLIPAQTSENIYEQLLAEGKINRRNQKIEDEVIYGSGQVDDGIPMLGKPGTIAFVDTCRCYHYGSRPGKTPRVLLHFHFYTAFARYMPLWGRRAKKISSISNNDNNINHEVFDAVTGLSHLDFANVRKRFNKKYEVEQKQL